MTTENHRFVRKMRDALRIRLVDDKNSENYERFLKEASVCQPKLCLPRATEGQRQFPSA